MRKLGKFFRHFLFAEKLTFFDVVCYFVIWTHYKISDWQGWALMVLAAIVSVMLTDIFVTARASEDEYL